MLTVELIYDTDCPNVKDARAQLLRAFAEVGLSPHWQEWNRNALESPPHIRVYGSPTILVNGYDVAAASQSADADCCRLYVDGDGYLRGVPSVAVIATALLRTKEPVSLDANGAVVRKSSWLNTLAVFPAIGTALLPNLTCPACWSAYAGLLSGLGLGFIDYTPYLLPLTIVFLALAIVSLGYRARRRESYTPFLLGFLAALLVIVGRFVVVSELVVYGGIAFLVGTSLWHSWP